VSVCGTTEESAVDRLDQVLAVRARAARELGVAFHVHSDACYGGYAASVLWKADGGRRTTDEIRASVGMDWPSDEWVRAMTALEGADSVTIDPHKLGFVPYPAGAFLLRDRRARDLVAVDPPYLLPAQGMQSGEDLFLGRFIFEGSKPGAAAASVWLSHKVLPLDERGYGYLIERTVAGARRLHAALRSADLAPFHAVVLPTPDINIVCYVLRHPSHTSLAEINAFNERIHARLSGDRAGAEYIITRTRFQSPQYDGAVDAILDALGVDGPDAWRSEGLVVLRSTVMDPFVPAGGTATDHATGLVRALRDAAEAVMTDRRG